MGCDIHLYLEHKRSINGKDKWVSVDNFRRDPYADMGEPQFVHESCFKDRNYELFSILADVRTRREEGIRLQPKDVPGDMSVDTEREYNRWDSDGHSHSYLTMRELVDLNEKLGNKRKYSGMVSPEDAIKIDSGTGTPEIWCQGTSDRTWVYREWFEDGNHLERLFNIVKDRFMKDCWIWEWTPEKYEQHLDKYRIVFWFDN